MQQHSTSLRNIEFWILKITFYVALLLAACGGSPKRVEIVGKIAGADKSLILLMEASERGIETIDSTHTDNQGYFELTQSVNTPSFYLIQVEGEDEPIIVLAEPGETVKIDAKLAGMARNYSVSGSKGSSLVRELNFRLNKTVNAIDSLSALFRSSRNHPRFDSIKIALDSSYYRTISEHKTQTIHFIKENRYSLAAILALHQQYGEGRHVLNEREDFELFRLIDSLQHPLYPDNPLVNKLHMSVAKMHQQLQLFDKRQGMFAVGNVLPQPEFKTLNGEQVMLNQTKYRYTLIDFWATWCNGCLSNNKKLRKIYNTYSAKGFGIVQISLDENRKELEMAIQRDSLQWEHVADFKQWASPIIDTLHIQSIPANYLIDSKGVVIGKNLTPKELNELLQKLLP
ncbi:MAG: TlpA disulfide reductase family protein [Tenuifilaceae bacterium]